MEGNGKYMAKHNTEVDRNEVVDYVKKYLNNELEKTLKTEEIPEGF